MDHWGGCFGVSEAEIGVGWGIGRISLIGIPGLWVVVIGRGSGPEPRGLLGLCCVEVLGVEHVWSGSVLDWRPDQALAGGWTVESHVEIRAGLMVTVSRGIPPRQIIIYAVEAWRSKGPSGLAVARPAQRRRYIAMVIIA